MASYPVAGLANQGASGRRASAAGEAPGLSEQLGTGRPPTGRLKMRGMASRVRCIEEQADMSLATYFPCCCTVKILCIECFFTIWFQYPADTPSTKYRRHPSDLVAIRVSAGTELSSEHTDHVR